MGILRSIDRRHETRTEADLTVTVWGVDTKGDKFLQEARAHEISLGGALLWGLDVELRSGDVLGILYAGRKARYRVIWVRYSGESRKIKAAVHRMEPDASHWQDLLPNESANSPLTVNPPVS